MIDWYSIQAGSKSITLREVTPADRELLFRIYASTREEELAPVPWTDEQKRFFLQQQFEAQDESYRGNYPGAEFSIIVADGCDAGRLYVHRRKNEIRIMDIALLPEFRNFGIGSALFRTVMDEGERTERP